MTQNMKIVFGLGVLMAVIGVGYLYLHQNNSTNTAQTEQSPLQSMAGTVISADPSARTVVIAASGVQKTLPIGPAAKIQKIIEQISAKGVIEKQAIAEVNIDALTKGTAVTVAYRSVENSVLAGVATVSFTVMSALDAYYEKVAKELKTNPVAYQKVRVVRVDTTTRILEYKPYLFDTVSSKTIATSYAATTPVHSVDDPTRVGILHARMPASLADIKPGTPLFLEVDNQALQKGSIIPFAFILVPE